MKKILLLFISLSLSLLLVLTGCIGKSEEENVAEEFLDSLVKERDPIKANEYFSSELKGKLDFEGLYGAEKENGEKFADSEEFKKYSKNLKAVSKKTKYTVELVEKNKVKVKIEYADISTPMKEAIAEYMKEELAIAFTEGKGAHNEEESQKKFLNNINSKLENYEPSLKTLETNIELKEENGKLVISKTEETLLEALTFGISELNFK